MLSRPFEIIYLLDPHHVLAYLKNNHSCHHQSGTVLLHECLGRRDNHTSRRVHGDLSGAAVGELQREVVLSERGDLVLLLGVHRSKSGRDLQITARISALTKDSRGSMGMKFRCTKVSKLSV